MYKKVTHLRPHLNKLCTKWKTFVKKWLELKEKASIFTRIGRLIELIKWLLRKAWCNRFLILYLLSDENATLSSPHRHLV